MNKPIYRKEKGVRTVWFTAENKNCEKGAGGKANDTRKGSPAICVKAHKSVTVAETKGSGVIRHMWFTILNFNNKEFTRQLKIKIYWDNSETPAVDAPFADFFCCNGGNVLPFQNALFSSPEGRSFNCYIPMPFKTGMKIELVNESDIDEPCVYYQTECTLGDEWNEDDMYFHAVYNRVPKTVSTVDYELLPKVTGSGRYLGTSVFVAANPRMTSTWYGEGEVKCYIDGDDEYPTLCGTGTEDYIGTGWNQGVFNHMHQGSLISDYEKNEYEFYRFHIADPVYFDKNIKVTIQQIGSNVEENKKYMIESGLDYYANGSNKKLNLEEPGAVGFERYDDDWSSVAYFYLDRA